MAKKQPLKYRHSTQLKTNVSDFLPIIGNKIPNKLLTYFDNADFASGLCSFVNNTTSSTTQINQNKSYRSDGCAQFNFLGGGPTIASVTTDFTAVQGYYNTPELQENFVDLKSISRKTNNFSQIYRSGSGHSDKDDLFFVVNVWNQILNGSVNFGVRFYSGTDVAILNLAYTPKFTKANQTGTWQKCQWALNNTYFTYNGNFTDSSWSNITKISIGGSGTIMGQILNGTIFCTAHGLLSHKQTACLRVRLQIR